MTSRIGGSTRWSGNRGRCGRAATNSDREWDLPMGARLSQRINMDPGRLQLRLRYRRGTTPRDLTGRAATEGRYSGDHGRGKRYIFGWETAIWVAVVDNRCASSRVSFLSGSSLVFRRALTVFSFSRCSGGHSLVSRLCAGVGGPGWNLLGLCEGCGRPFVVSPVCGMRRSIVRSARPVRGTRRSNMRLTWPVRGIRWSSVRRPADGGVVTPEKGSLTFTYYNPTD